MTPKWTDRCNAVNGKIEQVNFKMPAQLRSKLRSAAAGNRRSMTAEIVERLEASFQGAGTAKHLLVLRIESGDALCMDELLESMRRIQRESGIEFRSITVSVQPFNPRTEEQE